MTDWFRRLGRGQRIGVIVLAVFLLVNITLSALQAMIGGGSGGGPVSSSFSTGEDGLEGFADLVADAGHPVTKRREVPTSGSLDPAATVVVADPKELTETEARAIFTFVSRGGRLVLAGGATAPLLAAVTGEEVGWEQGDDRSNLAVWTRADGVGSARSIGGDGGGRWTQPGGLLPVAGASGAPSVLVGSVQGGRVIALADASPLHNQHLATRDNAAFGLAAVGPAPRRVIFIESVHGYAASGLSAVPSSWKVAAALVAVTVVVGLWAAGTRFGPPEPERRELRPPMLDHVEAVAANLRLVSPQDQEVTHDRTTPVS